MTENKERFEEIYGAYSGLILAYAARRTSNSDDAVDVVAETFTVAWRRINDLPDGHQARPWLYAVARRVLANQRRSVHRQRRLVDRLKQSQGPLFHIVGPDEDRTDLAPLAAALVQLSEQDQELLTLVAWDGLQREDLARIFGCSKAAIRVRLHRARKRLRRQLDLMDMKRIDESGHGQLRRAPALSDLEKAQ